MYKCTAGASDERPEACCARRFSKKNPPLATGASLGRRRHRKSIRGSAVSRNSHTDRGNLFRPIRTAPPGTREHGPCTTLGRLLVWVRLGRWGSMTPLRSKRARTPSVLCHERRWTELVVHTHPHDIAIKSRAGNNCICRERNTAGGRSGLSTNVWDGAPLRREFSFRTSPSSPASSHTGDAARAVPSAGVDTIRVWNRGEP